MNEPTRGKPETGHILRLYYLNMSQSGEYGAVGRTHEQLLKQGYNVSREKVRQVIRADEGSSPVHLLNCGDYGEKENMDVMSSEPQYWQPGQNREYRLQKLYGLRRIWLFYAVLTTALGIAFHSNLTAMIVLFFGAVLFWDQVAMTTITIKEVKREGKRAAD